jgi:hypothetical protein
VCNAFGVVARCALFCLDWPTCGTSEGLDRNILVKAQKQTLGAVGLIRLHAGMVGSPVKRLVLQPIARRRATQLERRFGRDILRIATFLKKERSFRGREIR